VTQVHDGVDGGDDVGGFDEVDAWYGVPSEPRNGRRPKRRNGLRAVRSDPEPAAAAPAAAGPSDEPLFERLRDSYLHGEDTRQAPAEGGWSDGRSGEGGWADPLDGWPVERPGDADGWAGRPEWDPGQSGELPDWDPGQSGELPDWDPGQSGELPDWDPGRSGELPDWDPGRSGELPDWDPGRSGELPDWDSGWSGGSGGFQAESLAAGRGRYDPAISGELGELDELWEPDGPVEPEEAEGLGWLPRRDRADSRATSRRTSRLLNASTVVVFVVAAAAAAVVGVVILGGQLLTTRQLFFMTHSAFGIVIVHAFGGGLGTLVTSGDSRMKDRIRKLSTAALAVVAWLASATGTWFGYAGYRAEVPPGGDISMYPREYLLHSSRLAFWETFAMEWKVHVGWTTPFLATAVAFVALRYRRRLVGDPLVRKVMANLLVIAFAGALVAAVLGALVNVTAPNDFMHRGWQP
jgi:hypothetical protein